ncbi:MAG: hypothetical protein IJ711_04790 [Lachnospiraceae bacterium]|nr:hypothetical protein [Lachnospiraceae bacterium]
MFFVREIKYLYFYDHTVKKGICGTCKCYIRDDNVTLDFCLKRLPVFYPLRARLCVVFRRTGEVLERELKIEESKQDYHIRIDCRQEKPERDSLFFYLTVSAGQFICDERTMAEHVIRQGAKTSGSRRKSEREAGEPERTEESERTKEPKRTGESGRAEESGRTKEPERAEESERVEEPKRPQQMEESERPERTERSAKEERRRLEEPYAAERHRAEKEEGRKNDRSEKPDGTDADELHDAEAEDEQADRDMYAASGQSVVSIPDRFGQSEKYYVIAPQQLRQFGEEFAKFEENSFLLHGFYNYRHILVGPADGENAADMCIGVPGNYYKREEVVAGMFGFLEFVPAKGAMQTGAFGYYYTPRMSVRPI